MQNDLLILFIGFPLLYVLFLWWYRGSRKPLSPDETERLLDAIKANAGLSGEDEPALFANFRELAKGDDSKQFYMVNLLKFREKSQYPVGEIYDDDPLQANARYNKIVMPALLKRGSHPVYVGKVAGCFIDIENGDEWDQVALVRYRSRRDMLKMAAEVAAKGGSKHKWAALEKTHVFPTTPVLSFMTIRIIVAATLALICAVFALVF